jgi:uncharacterized phage protein (TIGR01671 family)
MKREILFKALTLDGKRWLFGNLIDDGMDKKRFFILPADADNYDEFEEVNPDTVCQFTGLTDKNGNKIFEGDIIKNIQSDENVVFYWGNGFHYRNEHAEALPLDDIWNPCKNAMLGVPDNQTQHEIIGNIHD